jgi:hypothetical protein
MSEKMLQKIKDRFSKKIPSPYISPYIFKLQSYTQKIFANNLTIFAKRYSELCFLCVQGLDLDFFHFRVENNASAAVDERQASLHNSQ